MAARDPFAGLEQFLIDPQQPPTVQPQGFEGLDAFLEPADVGLKEASFLDKIHSAGVSLASGFTLTAPLSNIGTSGISDEEWLAWQTMPDAERKQQSVARGLEKVNKFVANVLPPARILNWMTEGRVDELAGLSAEQSANLIYKMAQLEEDKIVPGFWTQDLPHAIGMTVAFAIAGAAATIGTGGSVPAWAVAAWLGSEVGIDEAVQDALRSGASPEQATIAAGVGALLGTTEALGVSRILDRVDTATGGAISRRINGVLKQKLVGSVLKEGLKGAFEEGLQEAVQTVGQDTAAQLLYDPERPLFGRMIDAAQTGGGTGFILSAVSTALGIPLRQRQQRVEREKLIRQEVENVTGAAPDQTMEEAIRRDAPFIPLPPLYFEIQTEMKDIRDRMERMTELHRWNRTMTAEELRETLDLLGPGFDEVGKAGWMGRGLQGQVLAEINRGEINRLVEKDLPESVVDTVPPSEVHPDLWQSTEDTHILLDETGRFEIGNVTIDQGYKAQVPGKDLGTFPTLVDAQLAVEQAVYSQESARPLSVAEAIEKQPVVISGLNTFHKRVKDLEQRAAKAREAGRPDEAAALELELPNTRQLARMELALAKDFKKTIAGLRSKYMSPDTKIVVSGRGFLRRDQNGAAWSTSDGKIIQIGVDLEGIIPKHIDKPARAAAIARETLLHEFGHALAFQRFTDIQARVHAATVSPETIRSELGISEVRPAEGKRLPKTRQLYLLKVLELQEKASKEGKSPASQQDLLFYKGITEEYLSWASRMLSEPFIKRFETIGAPTLLAAHDGMVENAKQASPFSKNYKYWYNFDEFMAEMFARVGSQHAWATDSVKGFFTSQRKLLEEMYKPYANLKTASNFEDFIKHMSLEGKLDTFLKELAKNEENYYTLMQDPERARAFGIDVERMKQFEADQDNYHRWYRFGLNILQLGRLNPHIEPLQRYVRLAQRYNGSIGEFRWRGHNTLRDWRGLGKKRADLVGELLFEETLKGKALTPQELAQRGLNEDAIKVFQQVKEDFATVLNRMEKVLQQEARANFSSDPVTLKSELDRIDAEMKAMRDKPFFPLIRFGRHTIRVTATEKFGKWKKGQTVEFLTYDKRRERARDASSVRERWRGKPVSIGQGYLTDAEMAVQGMQGPMLRELRRKMVAQGNMNPEVEAAFESMFKDALPIESFRRHFARRRKVAGFSEDASRSYATYMIQAATHLARIEYQTEMNTAVANLARDSEEIPLRGGDGTKRGQIAEMTREHLDYMLNPTNDWPMLRSAGFVWFLGFNMKSAVVNSTQIFLATQPYLAARHGDIAATKALGKSIRDYGRYLAGDIKKLSKDQLDLLARGKADGWLDESLATELAIARSSSGLEHSLPVGSPKRAWSKFAEISAWPFHTVEKMNRALTALAAYDLARQRDLTHGEAVALAQESVNATQFEYARWARPKFMQGKVGSNVFLFKNYMQNMLFLALGKDPAASRVLFSMLLMGGMLGLPFGEDFLDFFDAAGSKMKKMLGWKNPKVQSRLFMREMFNEMNMSPELFMYGLSNNSFGLGYLGDLTGYPIPELDLHGSLSMGNIIPGTQSLKRLQEGQPGMALLQFMEELGGAEASYMTDIAQSLVTDNPDSWKRWEKSLPAFLRSISRSGRYKQRGGEFSARGEPIAEFDPFDAQDNMEIAAQLLGFTPRRVTKGWEQFMAEREITAYYEAWRRALMRTHNYSRLFEDDETIQASVQAIRDYNRQVPYPEMRLNAQTLRRSLQEFARSRAEAGRSIPPQRAHFRLSRDIEELYNEEP